MNRLLIAQHTAWALAFAAIGCNQPRPMAQDSQVGGTNPPVVQPEPVPPVTSSETTASAPATTPNTSEAPPRQIVAAEAKPSQPSGDSCTADSDCQPLADYCGGCNCRAANKSAAAPHCKGTVVQCVRNPCDQHQAHCQAGRCTLN